MPDPMASTGLKQRLIKEDNDLGLISSEYAPRLDRTKSKVDAFENVSAKLAHPPPDSEWVSSSFSSCYNENDVQTRYAMFILLLLLNLGFLVLFTHLS